MIDEHELVSVIVPAFNAEQTISETLWSIRRQTHRNLEIIVVDDGSTDGTSQCVSDHLRADSRIRIIEQSNGGVAAARNYGIKEARGKVIAPIDADDLWRPTKISRQLLALRAGGPKVKLVYTWSAYINENGKVINWGPNPNFEGDVLRALCQNNIIGNGSAALMLKSALLEHGGYDTSLKDRQGQGCEDWLLFLQIAETSHFMLVRDHLTGYRQARMAMSRNIKQMLRSDELVRSEMLARHPEYRDQIKFGRRSYLEWMSRRELIDGNWSAGLGLLQQIVLEDDRSLVRAGMSALRVAIRIFWTRSSWLSGPEFLPNDRNSKL